MKCSICESNNIKENLYTLPFLIEGGFIDTNICVCSNCGIHFRNIDFNSEKIKKHYDVASYVLPSYEETYKNQRKDFFIWLHEVANSYVTRSNKKLLDIGCSYGHMMQIFKEQGHYDVYGLELNANLREKLSTDGYKVFGNLEEISDSKFDVITLIDSLYCFEEPYHLMKHLNTLLSDDGILIIRITNRAWLASLFYKLGLKVPYIFMGDAKYSYTLKAMQLLLQKNGFLIEKVITTEKGKSIKFGIKTLFYKVTEILSKIPKIKISPGLIFICRKVKND